MTRDTGNANLAKFVEKASTLVTSEHDELRLTSAIANLLREALEAGLEVPESATVPDPDRYVMYPLHVDPEGRFSVASAVWNVGQGTPVHGHETWGVVGIYSGIEHEVSFEKPRTENAPLVQNGEAHWHAGEVTVCCTTEDDVHQVFCGGDQPCVGIHVYGADIGSLRRRSYQPENGAVSWFVSEWHKPRE